MSLLAIAVVLGALIALFVKAKWVRPMSGLVCILFGVLLAAGPAGPPIQSAVLQAGIWVDQSLANL
ncbi:hypothetical protein [Nocardioides insulae]|uniref:hypothetical protein n=1 Tax=Nocardioides insulae TaxID=394734 RepID=UPI0004011973|nr:hypothetical protein [Nocardioides insulae]